MPHSTLAYPTVVNVNYGLARTEAFPCRRDGRSAFQRIPELLQALLEGEQGLEDIHLLRSRAHVGDPKELPGCVFHASADDDAVLVPHRANDLVNAKVLRTAHGGDGVGGVSLFQRVQVETDRLDPGPDRLTRDPVFLDSLRESFLEQQSD